jgi:hypothetical protein
MTSMNGLVIAKWKIFVPTVGLDQVNDDRNCRGTAKTTATIIFLNTY